MLGGGGAGCSLRAGRGGLADVRARHRFSRCRVDLAGRWRRPGDRATGLLVALEPGLGGHQRLGDPRQRDAGLPPQSQGSAGHVSVRGRRDSGLVDPVGLGGAAADARRLARADGRLLRAAQREGEGGGKGAHQGPCDAGRVGPPGPLRGGASGGRGGRGDHPDGEARRRRRPERRRKQAAAGEGRRDARVRGCGSRHARGGDRPRVVDPARGGPRLVRRAARGGRRLAPAAAAQAGQGQEREGDVGRDGIAQRGCRPGGGRRDQGARRHRSRRGRPGEENLLPAGRRQDAQLPPEFQGRGAGHEGDRHHRGAGRSLQDLPRSRHERGDRWPPGGTAHPGKGTDRALVAARFRAHDHL